MRLLLGVLLRSAVIVVVIAVYVAVLNNSDSTDALSAGLLAFLILVTIAFAWALVDGVRLGFVAAILRWVLTSVVAGLGIPVVLAIANDTDVATEIGDGAVFFAFLLFLPAVAGLGIGGLVHRTRGPDETATG